MKRHKSTRRHACAPATSRIPSQAWLHFKDPRQLSIPKAGPPEGWWEAAFTLVPNASDASGHKCGSKQMLTIVAYDIREPRRLAKIAKTCQDFGVRIQYSVFECRLEADTFDRFWSALNDILDPVADRITAYKVCASCAKDIRDAGVQTHSQKVVAYVF